MRSKTSSCSNTQSKQMEREAREALRRAAQLPKHLRMRAPNDVIKTSRSRSSRRMLVEASKLRRASNHHGREEATG